MSNLRKNRLARSMVLAALSSLTVSAHAQDLTKDLKISGFLDLYFQYSGNKPATRTDIPFRNFDVRHNSFSLAALQLNIVKPTSADNPFGFTLNLLAGKNADLQTLGEPGNQNDAKFVQQAYATYAGPSGLTVDFGKFFTWIGYEGAISANNDLYGIGFLFTLGQPTYHTGLRATKTLDSASTAGVYLVNGWNEVEDSNAGKTYGASINRTFGKTYVGLNYYGGMEGAAGTNGLFVAGAGQTSVHMGDLIVVHQLTPNLKLAFNADYASAASINSGDPSGKWYGTNFTAKWGLGKGVSVAGRYETFSDPNGLRSGGDNRFNSYTAGLELATGSSSVLRLEIRNDRANRAIFESGEKSRTTYTFAHVLRF